MIKKESDKCILCGKKINRMEGGFCETCKTFLKWKHKEKFEGRLRLHKFISKILEMKRIKFRRKK